MSLLIEGIGAPITCADCDYSMYVGLGNMYCKLACKKEKTDIASKRRADFCPMKEIEEPHGRLGDLDKLWDRMYNYTDNEGAKMPFGDNDFMIHKDSACELIENAPTIIEGSKT
jgi:hypothetical protein